MKAEKEVRRLSERKVAFVKRWLSSGDSKNENGRPSGRWPLCFDLRGCCVRHFLMGVRGSNRYDVFLHFTFRYLCCASKVKKSFCVLGEGCINLWFEIWIFDFFIWIDFLVFHCSNFTLSELTNWVTMGYIGLCQTKFAAFIVACIVFGSISLKTILIILIL